MMSQRVNRQFDVGLALLGFLVALFSAGIGIGGGTLLVSILVSVFGFDFKKAASTSLATIIPISFVGSASHFVLLPEILHPRYYVMFIPACVLGAMLGGRIVRKRQNGWLKVAFSLFLLVVSLRMLRLFDFSSLVFGGFDGVLLSSEWLLIVPVGILIGIIAVLLGVGCGLLIVPFFVMVIHLDIHEAITLSLTTMFFLTISATLIHNRFKTLDMAPVKRLFIPALAGAVVGATLSSHLPAHLLKNMLGLFLFVIACHYVIHEIGLHGELTASVEDCGEEME